MLRKSQVRELEALELEERRWEWDDKKLNKEQTHEINKLEIERNGQIAELRFQNTELNTRSSELKRDIKDRENQIERLRKEKEASDSSLRDLRGREQQLQFKVNSHEGTIRKLERQNEELMKRST